MYNKPPSNKLVVSIYMLYNFYAVCPTVYYGAMNRSAEYTFRINCPKSISDSLPSNINILK